MMDSGDSEELFVSEVDGNVTSKDTAYYTYNALYELTISPHLNNLYMVTI